MRPRRPRPGRGQADGVSPVAVRPVDVGQAAAHQGHDQRLAVRGGAPVVGVSRHLPRSAPWPKQPQLPSRPAYSRPPSRRKRGDRTAAATSRAREESPNGRTHRPARNRTAQIASVRPSAERLRFQPRAAGRPGGSAGPRPSPGRAGRGCGSSRARPPVPHDEQRLAAGEPRLRLRIEPIRRPDRPLASRLHIDLDDADRSARRALRPTVAASARPSGSHVGNSRVRPGSARRPSSRAGRADRRPPGGSGPWARRCGRRRAGSRPATASPPPADRSRSSHRPPSRARRCSGWRLPIRWLLTYRCRSSRRSGARC